jgi:Velvet factor
MLKLITRCSLEYEIIVRQQPLAARACGFGERDRRVIDPPPILQMIVRDPRATPADLSPQLRYPHSVVHCELWNADADIQETAIPELGEKRQQRRLMGTLVASPFYGQDEFGVAGCFFPFPDLSCRTIGKYRLRFVLLLPNPASMRPGDSLPFRAVVISDVFHVYTAKTFPGMEPSTALTRRLKEQGCLISVKKGHQRSEKMKEAQSRDEDDEVDEDADEDEDEEASSEKGREKRQNV